MTNNIGTTPNGGTVISEYSEAQWAAVEEFTDYCRSFYSLEVSDSLYPFASEMEIVEAVNAHITDPNPRFPFDGDSADREAVRDRICAVRRFLGFGEPDFDKAVAMARQGIMPC